MKFSFKKTIFWISLILLTICIVSAFYCWYLTKKIETRFSGRRWQIPSTVYSDKTLLFPGKKINLNYFPEKLKKLGYQRKGSLPEKKGEYDWVENQLNVFLKDLDQPGHKREGFHAVINFEDNEIKEITDFKTGQFISILEFGSEIIMQFFGKDRELRKVVTIENVPDYLIKSVIGAEDNRFFNHFGVDPTGILRALYTNIRYGAIRQGGSTLTQQLAKNYFLTPERTYRRKFNELFISIAIEIKYNKNEILEIYLNEIYFGQKGSVSINGVGEASEFYFGKKPKNLTLSESAIIAGMIKGPNLFSPYASLEKCTKRRNQVLNTMRTKGWISDDELLTAKNESIKTVGFERYNRTAPYFLDYVSRQLKELYPKTILSSMGFSIYTTLDTEVQAAAEKALENGLARLEKKKPELKRDKPEDQLQGAVVVIQPRTGNILAMVGGRNYSRSQFNRITQAKRQSGSCFKPIILSTFLDVFKPSDLLSNEKTSYIIDDKMWTPDNFGEISVNQLSVRDMLKLSCNRAAVDMVIKGGLDQVVDNVSKFKFSTEFAPYPSIALGAFDIIPIELARAYCTFAADGIQPFPLSLKDVVDEKDNVLVRRHMEIDSLISPAKAFLISSMLESVVKNGTARSLKWRGIDFCVAGKTGTTNNFRDAWFIGYTPDFLALVWVGFDNGDSIFSTGSEAALPIWSELVQSMPGYVSKNNFTIPPGILTKRICSESGKIAVALGCTNVYDEYFLDENVPEVKCHIHSGKSSIKRFFNGFKNIFK